MEHVSVLKSTVQKYLDLREGDVVIDTTLGLGGHAADCLKRVGGSGLLIAFEQDERNLKEAKIRLKQYEKQIVYIHDNFRYLKSRVTSIKKSHGFDLVDAIFFDLGLSSPHVDDGERGFAFLKDGPLDMRFDQRQKLTASEVVNGYSEEDLVRIFFEYGEEKMSRKAAKAICERRVDKKFSTTGELASFLEGKLHYSSKRSSKAHPATKIFQAIRIEVNDELNVLKEALDQAIELLKVGGRVVVISYHSLEDRIVKQFFQKLLNPPASSDQMVYRNFGDPIVEKLSKKPVTPTSEEILENSRSRSAKLRAYVKLR
jgi:16S rRNA (cytosine1402-N4)-methyltransferase